MPQRLFVIKAVLLAALNLFDALMTISATTGNTDLELNPLMRFLLELGPWSLFFPIKMLGVLGAISAFYCLRTRHPKLVDICLNAAIAVYILIALWHVVGIQLRLI